MKWCCVFRGEFNTLASCPKTNYIGTNFLDAREFSEGSQESSCWGFCLIKVLGKVYKYLSLVTMLMMGGRHRVITERGRCQPRRSDECQLNGLMFVHCVKSNKREPSQRWGGRWCLDWRLTWSLWSVQGLLRIMSLLLLLLDQGKNNRVWCFQRILHVLWLLWTG